MVAGPSEKGVAGDGGLRSAHGRRGLETFCGLGFLRDFSFFSICTMGWAVNATTPLTSFSLGRHNSSI